MKHLQRPVWLLAGTALLAGCVTSPVVETRRVVVAEPEVQQIFVYPAAGQTDARLDRDRYECHNWAVKESGYDPSSQHAGYRTRIEVVSAAPPGTNTVGGALTGAILGAAVARPGHAGGAAAVGAIAGAAIGASVDSANQERAARVQQRYDSRSDRESARAGEYKRAITACLEGRSYTVQ